MKFTTEKQDKKLKEFDKELDEQLLKIFDFDKCDVINLTKEDFLKKMSIAKLVFNTYQMKGLFEGMRELKI